MAGGAPIGNKNAVHKKPFEKALLAALARHEKGYPKSLEAIGEEVVAKAMEGERWAIEMLADRLDGKPKQQVENTGADGGPLHIIIAEQAKRMAKEYAAE